MHHHGGLVAKASGDVELARKRFERSLEINPRSTVAKDAKRELDGLR